MAREALAALEAAARDSSLEIRCLNEDLSIPLVLDLDGTLLSTDSRHEYVIASLKRLSFREWLTLCRGSGGQAKGKKSFTEVLKEDDVAAFPINVALARFAEREASRGRRIILATAGHRSIAEMAARRFPFITEVIATGREQIDPEVNTLGDELQRRYPGGFIYAGDSKADLDIWRRATGALFAGRSKRLTRQLQCSKVLLASFPRERTGFSTLRRGLRLHQWAKNALLFLPLILGGKAGDGMAWLNAFIAFLAIGFLASATYLVNDLWDLPEDRRHWSKRLRPLANGNLSIAEGVALSAAAGTLAFALAATVGVGCVSMLVLYLTVTIAYSMKLKREPLVDVFVLAGLFTIRLALGIVVTGVVFSPWLAVFSMFVFLSLSLAKRFSEVTRMVAHGWEQTAGRGYKASDAPLILVMGVSAMLAAVLIVVIYLINDAFPTGFYQRPNLLWGCAFVIFLWLSRIWLLCHRGELNDDPVAFALKDRTSLIYGSVMVLIFLAAYIRI